MVGEEFVYEHGKARYSQGQPMGAYSSWPIMAISHHLIIRYAGRLCGITEPKYWVLGDDALIIGDELFNSYKNVCNLLNMKVNDSKTFRSTEMFEFAKRFFYKRKEISAFPLGAVISSNGDIARMAVAFDNARAKSWFGGSSWYRSENVNVIRKTYFKMLSCFFTGPDVYISVDRGTRLLKTFAIMRNVYKQECNRTELLSIIPALPKCNASLEAVVKRLQYLIQLSVREKAMSTLTTAHTAVFMKRSEFLMKLMMSGLPAPPMLPGQSTM